MKKYIFVLLALSILCLGYELPRPRFESVLTEKVFHENSNYTVDAVEVLHDKETGQEIVCARGWYSGGIQNNYSMSCWVTGRKWQ